MPPAAKSLKPAKTFAAKGLSVAQAKAQFCSVVNTVERSRTAITILRRGVPVAAIVPLAEPDDASGFGYMRGTVKVLGDYVGPSGEAWDLEDA